MPGAIDDGHQFPALPPQIGDDRRPEAGDGVVVGFGAVGFKVRPLRAIDRHRDDHRPRGSRGGGAVFPRSSRRICVHVLTISTLNSCN